MLTNPKENRTHFAIVQEEFRRKGYQCREEKQENVTILFLTHEKKLATHNEMYSVPELGPIRKFQGCN